MKYSNKILLALLLLPLFSIAQTNYQPGYVVNLKGDTLRGFINYKEWRNNPKEIRFKSSLNTDAVKNFSTANASAFTITGLEYYQRFTLSISQDPIELANLSIRPDTTHLTEAVFLRISAKGQYLTLYRYIDDLKQRLYIRDVADPSPLELIYQAYYNQETMSIVHVYGYRAQLENLAQKYNLNTDKIRAQISGAGYSEDELIKIVQAINGDSSREFTPIDLFGTRFFAGTGINYSDLKFTGDIPLPDRHSTFPRISGGIDFLPNKNIQRIFLRIEGTFTANMYNWSKNNYYYDPHTDFTSSLNIKLYTFSIIPQILYNVYDTGPVKMFIDAGVSFNFSSYNNYNYIENYGTFYTSVLNKYFQLANVWESFPIKAGVLLKKKLEVYIGYTLTANMGTGGSLSNTIASTVSYQAGINYLFGAK